MNRLSYIHVGVSNLDEAEDLMLELYCERAQLRDGMNVLELGCGWGSLCLFLAEKYPNSRITAISNSKTQRDHITKVASSSGLDNLTVVTADVNAFATSDRYDRIVSIGRALSCLPFVPTILLWSNLDN